jgi:hypothetical protein
VAWSNTGRRSRSAGWDGDWQICRVGGREATRRFGDLERSKSADFYARVGALGRVFINIEREAFARASRHAEFDDLVKGAQSRWNPVAVEGWETRATNSST